MAVAEWIKKLKKEFIVAQGIKTAIFVAPDNGKPVALFIHGINGDHHGVVPLAHQSQRYRPILVDLPGHGDTAIPEDGAADIVMIRSWFADVHRIITERYGEPALFVAHSFGCYAIHQEIKTETVLICPVPAVSRFYNQMLKFGNVMFKTRVVIKFYNWFPFSVLRGIKLLRVRTKRAIKLVVFLSRVGQAATVEQRRYQARLSFVSSAEGVFENVHPTMVIIGSADTVSQERTADQMKTVFPRSDIHTVTGGHLAPIENTQEIFAIIGL